MWRPFTEQLAERFTVIRYDKPGCWPGAYLTDAYEFTVNGGFSMTVGYRQKW